jgi:hypothetical protein
MGCGGDEWQHWLEKNQIWNERLLVQCAWFAKDDISIFQQIIEDEITPCLLDSQATEGRL